MRLTWVIILFLCWGCTATIRVPKETYATVDQTFWYTNVAKTSYHFYVDSQYIWVLGSFSPDYELGEKFKMVYDSLNPYRYNIKIGDPIFLPQESTEKVVGKIVYLSKYYCQFEYPFKDNTELVGYDTYFKRSQYLYGDEKLKYPGFSVGQEYLVEYWSGNYKRAIIHFDKPIKENDPLHAKSLTTNDTAAYLPNWLKISNDRVIINEKKASDGTVKEVKYSVVGKNNNLNFTINSFVFSSDKLIYEPEPDTYKAEKVKLTKTDGGTVVKGNKLSYRQDSGKIKMEGNIEITKGDKYIKSIDELTIEALTGAATYIKDGSEKKIML